MSDYRVVQGLGAVALPEPVTKSAIVASDSRAEWEKQLPVVKQTDKSDAELASVVKELRVKSKASIAAGEFLIKGEAVLADGEPGTFMGYEPDGLLAVKVGHELKLLVKSVVVSDENRNRRQSS